MEIRLLPALVLITSLTSAEHHHHHSGPCSLERNTLRCWHQPSYPALAASLALIKSSYIQNEHAVFRRLHLFNCTLNTLPPDAFLGLKFASIHLENVTLHRVHRLAFGPTAVYVKRLIYRNDRQGGHACARFHSHTDYDLFEALASLRYLQLLELCAHNDNEIIRGDAFAHSYLKTIRFNGNYSQYSIQPGAFRGLKRIVKVVFNRVAIGRVEASALDVGNLVEAVPAAVIFNRCRFGYDLHDNLARDFSRANNSGLYFYSSDLVSVRSVDLFRHYLAHSPSNYLYLTKLDCDTLLDSADEYFKMRQFFKAYRSQLRVKCARDVNFWKSFLESDEPNWFNHSTAASLTAQSAPAISSLATMYSLLFQGFSTEFDAFSLPKSIEHRWFADLSTLLGQVHENPFVASSPTIQLLLQMLDTSAMVALDQINSSIEQYQLDQNENLHCSVAKLKGGETHLPEKVEVSHTGDAVQLVHSPANLSELYLVSTWAHIEEANDTELGLNTNLISVNLVESVRSHTRIHNATVKIRFHNLHRRRFGDRARCVFWNFSTASWSDSGCQYLAAESTSNSTVCQCSHLTNFAALLDVSGREDNRESLKALLTNVFCTASALCLLVSIGLSFHLGRNQSFSLVNDQFRRRASKATLNLNMAICLLITNLLTILGMDRREPESVCLSFSLTLSFFLLASFTFMLLQGYHLLKSISGPLVTDLRHGNYCAVGYGVPTVILATSVLAIWAKEDSLSEVFIGDFFCWISTKKDPLYIFIIVVPISAAILTNVVFFLCTISHLIRRNRYLAHFAKALPHPSLGPGGLSPRLSRQSLSLVLLLFNLGITWLVYLLYITEYGHFFSYLFIVLNGSQGVTFLVNQILVIRSTTSSRKTDSFRADSSDEEARTRSNSRLESTTTQMSLT